MSLSNKYSSYSIALITRSSSTYFSLSMLGLLGRDVDWYEDWMKDIAVSVVPLGIKMRLDTIQSQLSCIQRR